MADTALVTVAAIYRQKVFPRRGTGAIQGIDISLRGEFDLALKDVPESLAHPVATLPLEHGGSIVLREHEGRFLRPVLAPGSLEPMDAEGFRSALAGYESLRDDPFAQPDYTRDRNTPPRSVGERVSNTDPDDCRKVGENNSEEVRDELLRRSADVILVEGVPHVACPEPRLLLKSIVSPEGRLGRLVLTWSLPGLDGDDHPELGPSSMEPLQHHELQHKGPAPRPRKRLDYGGKARWRWLSLGEGLAAEAFGRRLATLMSQPFDAPRAHVTIHDPRPFSPMAPPDPTASAKAAIESVGSKLSQQPRDRIEAWLDARDSAAAGDPEAALAILADTCGILDPEVEKVKAISWPSGLDHLPQFEAGAYLLRYAMVEANAVPTPEERAIDDADLAALSRFP